MKMELPPGPESSEHEHQKYFIKWIRDAYPDLITYATPNGGKRTKRNAAVLRSEGVLSGIPDIFIADGNPGMYIEMKRQGGHMSDISSNQAMVLTGLEKKGYRVAVCFGWQEAVAAAQFYLRGYYRDETVHKVSAEQKNYVLKQLM